MGFSSYGPHPNAPGDPSTLRFDGSHVQFSFFFNSEFKLLLTHKSDFHVTGFSYGSNTRDALGRISCNWANFDAATTTTTSWILANTASRWILLATTSSQVSGSEFQHTPPIFGPEILSAVVGISSWRASHIVGNASVDDTDVIETFFFATNDNTYSCLSILTFTI
jgi:hypothetical protein